MAPARGDMRCSSDAPPGWAGWAFPVHPLCAHPRELCGLWSAGEGPVPRGWETCLIPQQGRALGRAPMAWDPRKGTLLPEQSLTYLSRAGLPVQCRTRDQTEQPESTSDFTSLCALS